MTGFFFAMSEVVFSSLLFSSGWSRICKKRFKKPCVFETETKPETRTKTKSKTNTNPGP
jgi:hypothetical protein